MLDVLREYRLDYYQRQEQRELSLAKAALNPGIAQVHRDLAARYRAMLSGTV